jgi:hypothetical protein
MPCLFIRNVPPDTSFDPEFTRVLYEEIAALAGCEIDEIEVHIETTQYKILLPDGSLSDQHGVHVFVEWHEGRSVLTKIDMGIVIHNFLKRHGLGEGTDITFRDYPRGESFVFNGEMVR